MLTNDEKLVENIKATMAMEGLELHQEDVSLINEFLENKITQGDVEKCLHSMVNNSET